MVIHPDVEESATRKRAQVPGQEDQPAKEVSGRPVELIAGGDGALLGLLATLAGLFDGDDCMKMFQKI